MTHFGINSAENDSNFQGKNIFFAINWHRFFFIPVSIRFNVVVDVIERCDALRECRYVVRSPNELRTIDMHHHLFVLLCACV